MSIQDFSITALADTPLARATTPRPEMHWSRWGDPAEAGPVSDSVRGLIDMFLGASDTPAVSAEQVALSAPLAADLVAELGAIVGPEHVSTAHSDRLLRTRGKSTPDLLKIRSGDGSESPDVVVRPGNAAEIEALIAWCVRQHVALVPFGGGTSVVGGLVADRGGFNGVVCLDLMRLDRLISVDRESMTAVLEPGLRGPQAEALLADQGLTLGHFPQSFEYASIGGFAVTRSSGQSSAGYGRFDSMVLGLSMVTPKGVLELGMSPSNASGPDLREVVMGSEGTLGVVTAVRVRVRALPEHKVYETWRFESFFQGAAAMRMLAQSGVMPTVLRLSDENETSINLAKPSEVGGQTSGGVLMIVGHEGTPAAVAAKRAAVTMLLEGAGGVCLGDEGGEAWAKDRFHGPYLRDSLLDIGVLVETLETVTYWSRIEDVYRAVNAALVGALGEATLVLCHISHVYETGCSLYFTVATKASDEPLPQWMAAKAAACDALMEHGASITHHHAVGRDHKAWLEGEIGEVGVGMLRALKADLDPTGVLNPGVLIP
ncbi:MAG: FAD-binding oxidoreductase [Marmoricola sp.]